MKLKCLPIDENQNTNWGILLCQFLNRSSNTSTRHLNLQHCCDGRRNIGHANKSMRLPLWDIPPHPNQWNMSIKWIPSSMIGPFFGRLPSWLGHDDNIPTSCLIITIDISVLYFVGPGCIFQLSSVPDISDPILL